MNKPIVFEKPQGVRDFLPGIAKRKREIERKIADCYASWGYQEVITPTFEYMETFQNGLRGEEDRVFKFIERSGKTVVLRPDMTTPIARVVASLLRDEPLPLRLSYNANIFRQQEFVAGRDAEFTQAGVELIGDGSPDADAEMIALAVTTLRSLGVQDFRLALGQVGFVNGILAEHVADHELADRMRFVLADKNYVGFEHLVAQVDDTRAREVLLHIPQLRGGLDVLQRARALTTHETALQALGNLEEIWEILVLYGVEQWVQIDLGLVLGLNYYTGAIFEGYAPQIGFPLCGGGRYDDLLEKFGRSLPATGFMIGIERVLEVLERKGNQKGAARHLLYYLPRDRHIALGFAAYLRRQGYTVTTQRILDFTENEQRDGVIICRLENDNLVTEDESVRTHYDAFLEQQVH
jgi:ATP phosphoribosyltransferase regulatory subunit